MSKTKEYICLSFTMITCHEWLYRDDRGLPRRAINILTAFKLFYVPRAVLFLNTKPYHNFSSKGLLLNECEPLKLSFVTIVNSL